MKRTQKIYILGTGQQAPYGIGEIIDIIPMSHWRKIQALCSDYYNKPSLRLNGKDGKKVDFNWNEWSQKIDGLRIVS